MTATVFAFCGLQISKTKGKEEHLYSAFLANEVHSKRSGMDHTVFSERELTFTFAICYRPSVCRLSSVCL